MREEREWGKAGRSGIGELAVESWTSGGIY